MIIIRVFLKEIAWKLQVQVSTIHGTSVWTIPQIACTKKQDRQAFVRVT